MNILAIDIGSSTIKCAIARFDGEQIKILDTANAPTCGIKSGRITSIQEASASIQAAIKSVKENLSVDIEKVVVSVSSAYTQSLTGFSELRLDGTHSQIKLQDIAKAIENAKISAGIARDQIPIHVLPFKFKANGTDVIEDPLDMRASSLRLEANIITMNINDYENIRQILTLAQIQNYELVSSVYADMIYCLNSDEKENCMILIDCGAQVCDIAVCVNNSLVWMASLPFGSAHITSDIAKYLTTTNEIADKIKLKFQDYKDDENATVDYRKTSSNTIEQVSVSSIVKCVEIRVNEMLDAICGCVQDSPFAKNYSSVLLTGGCFKINEIADIAMPKFNNKAIRILIEKNKIFSGDFDIFTKPEFTCLLGLCMYASGFHNKYEFNSNGSLLTKQKSSEFSRIKNFENLQPKTAENNNFQNFENRQKSEQVLLNAENTEKDEILAMLKNNDENKSKENWLAQKWKAFCDFIERIF